MDNAACWASHRPEAIWRSRWATHPTSEASDQKCRSGDTWQRDTPRDRRGRWSHHWRSRRHSIDAYTGASRSGRSQDRWRQSWRDRILSLPPGTRWASEERTPSSDSQKLAVGEAQDRNSAAIDCSRGMHSTGEALKEVEAMTTPRYWITCDGTRLDFWGLTTIPNSWQSWRTVWRSSRRDSREDDWTSQSSRYRLIRIPIEWSIAETGAMTLVKTCGAVERPKHSALNW